MVNVTCGEYVVAGALAVSMMLGAWYTVVTGLLVTVCVPVPTVNVALPVFM